MALQFKQFIEEDLTNWLLGRKERTRTEDDFIVPPPSVSTDQLIKTLEIAEKTGNQFAIRKAHAAIEKNGYTVKSNRYLVPKSRSAAK